MNVTIHNLIQVASFPEETRKKLLAKVDKMSDDQRFRLIDLCWFAIADRFQSRLNYEIDKAIMETARGEKHYSQKDFEVIRENIMLDYMRKLAVSSEEDKKEINEQIIKHSSGTPKP